ncbi:sugar phosphate isomerase/epimerase [Sphingobium sp. DEHP117]|uniref:sugar phosphate isomerase/epimerase family protein n=1 Tax=Sphingobium sp. DEHP117 TaxID=2993436 RepID=UPI0027D58995|nr:sugar phosphate isomerase/epimerase [Sphingobium sp. DEHP117]MDQ4419280.1 sugar phosphate isomerase/epimerase [Sphingobium sp. DEHP117]
MVTTTAPQIGVTLYSFTNEWLSRQFDFPDLMREVARRGLGPNIEIIGFQNFKEFPDVSDDFAARFKDIVAETGLNPVSCAINSDRFLRPGQQPIDDASLVEYHKRQLRSAKKMGFSLVRYQFALPVHLLPEVAPYAEELDIRMGVEVHAPMWAGHPAVQAYAEMYDKLDTPVLGWIPDFGGTASRIPESMLDAARRAGAAESLLDRLKLVWLEPGMSHEKAGRLREWALAQGHAPAHIQAASLAFFILSNNDPLSWAQLVDRTIHIHGKFYGVDENLVEEAIDYAAILPLFRDGGFTGTIVSEWEGHAYDTRDAFEQVSRHQAMCRQILAS